MLLMIVPIYIKLITYSSLPTVKRKTKAGAQLQLLPFKTAKAALLRATHYLAVGSKPIVRY